jgi:hypothetical protein
MARSTVAAVALVVALVALTALPHGAAAVQCKPSISDPSPGPSDKVVLWSKGCDDPQNQACDSCTLYQKTVAFKSQPFIYSGSQSGVPRAKLIPTKVLPGIESAVRDRHDTSSYWVQALADASKGGVLPGVPNKAKHPIAFANSLNARAQHQLHLHIGEPQSGNTNFYTCAKKIITSPPAVGSWTDAKAYDAKSSACQALRVHRDIVMYATSSAGNKISSAIYYGFTNVIKEAQSKDITKDAALQHTAVLVQPKANGDYLVFLITNTNDEKIYGNRT